MKNKAIIYLIISTGLLFTAEIFLNVNFPFVGLGFVTGMSAIMTKFLVKD